MQRMRLRMIRTLATGCWIALALSSGFVGDVAKAADRPADQILADIDAVAIPKPDPSISGDTRAMTEYLTRRNAALARRGALTLELYKASPDNPRLAALFSDRWQNMIMQAATPQALATLNTELDEISAATRQEKLKADAAFFRTILKVRSAEGGPDEILKSVEQFIKLAPKDERGALLLYSVGNQLEGSPRQVELFKRVVEGYPESRFASMARSSLKKTESLGKPFDLEFNDAIKGTSISMKDLKGKVVVIDFWATWCGPCVGEMPKMKQLYAEYHGKGVEFIGVSLDNSKEEGGFEALKTFVAHNELTWPQYYQGNGWESGFSSSWGINSIPAVFVVDQEGNLYSVDARGKLGEMIPELLKKATAARSGE